MIAVSLGMKSAGHAQKHASNWVTGKPEVWGQDSELLGVKYVTERIPREMRVLLPHSLFFQFADSPNKF